MLQRLAIRNVALIDRAEIEFSDGLNVLSGETGAGKSVILDAIDFVLGAKADRGMIRSGASDCSVYAEFFGTDDRIDDILSEFDIEAGDTLVLSRKLTSDGKSSLKLNGCSVTAAMLRRITSLLVDVHGQSEHFYLLREANQLRLLDSVAGEPVAQCKEILAGQLSERRSILEARKKLGGEEGERERRLDILKYQIDEIERAQQREGEEEELIAFREKFRNAEKIMDALGAVRQFLSEDGGSADTLRGAGRSLLAITRLDERYSALSDRIESAAAEAEDIAETAEDLAAELDVDEREAERVEARLDELRAIKKKYGGSVPEVQTFLQQAKEEYDLLSDSEAKFEQLGIRLQAIEDEIYKTCISLQNARKEAAEGFTARVVKELATLNISSPKFEIAFGTFSRDDVPHATAEGLGGVTFLFSANAGEPLKELGKIISGGEMSRFMLAIKTQLSAVNSIGTYIFDEIDAGIGGRTARVVGEKFCRIAKNVQIIAVSHLAQIAAFADREFYIEKRELSGRTVTQIHSVEGEARVREIARLIGGDPESETALMHAKELLDNAERYKNSLT